MASKFVIRKLEIGKDELVMGNVEYHKELIKSGDIVRGGGRWLADHAKKILYLWGHSSDFGQADSNVIFRSLPNSLISPFLEGYKVFYSSYISDTLPELNTFEEIWTIPYETKMTCSNCPTEDTPDNMVPHYDPSAEGGEGGEVPFCKKCYHEIFMPDEEEHA